MLDPDPNPIPEPDPEPKCIPVPVPLRQKVRVGIVGCVSSRLALDEWLYVEERFGLLVRIDYRTFNTCARKFWRVDVIMVVLFPQTLAQTLFINIEVS